ncbi:MAG TPA: hypothetical protein VK513_04790 [Terriglobales bacterium]|nr:hypothetical protein [Terriglobales bacterium]
MSRTAIGTTVLVLLALWLASCGKSGTIPIQSPPLSYFNISGNPSDDICKVLRHPVVADSKDLDNARIVEERVCLRAINLELSRVVPERPHGKPPARRSVVAINNASSRPRFPISSQSISVRSFGECRRWVSSRINLESHSRSNRR